tara:strand:- start:5790 stop:6038 length:249 start_codon:yes stop_codon:yes gene_type:complete
MAYIHHRRVWIPAVLSHMRKVKRPLTYNEIIENTELLSVFPKKMLIKSNRCPTRGSFTRVMKLTKEVENYHEKKERYWRLVE